ncbi:GNAT family N-acetyltransferase [Micromonospora sp. WMMD961]|uniref:GNAT family N-acetyltransferase n=1 Tax=Micromonospora sp. WMMD961 TaxID=3016100 RepID=UPI0024166EBE|nr:GNAT family N-acetyltransferase [Micromonospora sp. WMMD961]MDG4781204.1 GNAT family N-acetyltransferase [Micromonospora sp. WMMD961]
MPNDNHQGQTRADVRAGTAADALALAGLRWRRLTEEGGYRGDDHADFVRMFAAWVVEHLSTHRPFVAEVDGEVVGMAWLMVVDRVPAPTHRHRRTGDVQAVYVVPELRDGGIGAALLTEVLAEARTLGLEHVTVHSSERAVGLYQRMGFQHGPTWLSWQPE